MRAAYDALDAATRRLIEDKAAYHSLYFSQDRAGLRPREGESYRGYGFHDQPPPLRPLVKVHPETGRPNLIIGRHAYGIPGLSAARSEALLDELLDFACRPPRIYHHSWRPGDAVLWDNRCLMHRACPWNMTEPRVMYHARIAGNPETESGVEA
jgi:alpha-ketoglutarate-dependent taurine dioxygenase